MFKVGEECKYVNALDKKFEGETVLVVGQLEPRMVCDADFVGVVDCYIVEFVSYPGMPLRAAEPFRLRKRQERGNLDLLVKWSDCGWKPQGVNA